MFLILGRLSSSVCEYMKNICYPVLNNGAMWTKNSYLILFSNMTTLQILNDMVVFRLHRIWCFWRPHVQGYKAQPSTDCFLVILSKSICVIKICQKIICIVFYDKKKPLFPIAKQHIQNRKDQDEYELNKNFILNKH